MISKHTGYFFTNTYKHLNKRRFACVAECVCCVLCMWLCVLCVVYVTECVWVCGCVADCICVVLCCVCS